MPRQVAGLIDFEDAPRPFEYPLDAATATRFVFFVVDGGHDDLIGADGHGPHQRSDFEAFGVRVEVGEVTAAARLGVGIDGGSGAEEVGEVAGAFLAE